MAQDYTIDIKVKGLGEAANQLAAFTDELNAAREEGQSVSGALDYATGGAVTGFKKAASGVQTFIKGLKMTRAALIATGIGAFVVAVGALVGAFSKTRKATRALNVVFAGIGASLDLIFSRMQAVGGYIVRLFTKGHTAAAAAFREEMDALPGSIAEAQRQAVALEKATQALTDAQNALTVQRAKDRAEIKRLNMIAEDTTKGIREREEAAKEAIRIEQNLMMERQRIAAEELRIAQEKAAMSDTSEEDLQRLAELEANLINIQTESLELQTTLNNKLNILRGERTRLEEEAAAEAELNRVREEAMENTSMMRRIEATDAMEKQRGLIMKDAENRRLKTFRDNNKAIEQELEEHNERITEDEKNAAEQRAMLRVQAQGTAFTLLRNLNQAFEGDTEKAQKKAFQRNKALSIAETLMSTYQAAQKAYASQLSVPTLDAPIRASVAAGVAVAAGLANVAAIASQKFTGGSTSAGGARGGVAVGGGGGVGTVGVDVGTLVPTTQQTTPEPVRAYVVSNEISNKQALDRELQIQTTL